ncbi:MAG: SgcJ/EcaC family oxidoreductase [Planctomycetaceae bacterium]|nr:SgcJ/EcaC family oxidoreductase [Planctomycetaceae bacterium]
MKHAILFAVVLLAMSVPSDAQQRAGESEEAVTQAIRERIAAYVEAFNKHDAEAVGAYWTANGVSVAAETGVRTEGRAALVEEFAAFFKAQPDARLSGQVENIRMVRPDVATVEGTTVISFGDAVPVESAFSAVLVKEANEWLIDSSQERDLPVPSSSYDALKELEWLVGTWKDQAEGAEVTTTVRWSPSRAFLLRSFAAQFGEGDEVQGTQIIGWDPMSQQIRTWTFNSDGSFGQGTVSRHDDQWMLKMWQVVSDGSLMSATKVMTRIDDDTMTVETVGQTRDGEPVPAPEPVTVMRTSEGAPVSEMTEGVQR